MAIAATFTAEPLMAPVTFWGGPLNTRFELRFAPYNQVLQWLLDPASDAALSTHGVNVVLLRLADLAQLNGDDLDLARLEENVQHFADALRAAPSRMSVPLIVSLCPSPLRLNAQPGYTAAAARMESMLEAALDETPGAQFIPHHAIDRCYPVPDPHSPAGDELGRIPYGEAYYCALATMLVRHTHSLFRAPYKLIALDCDNTLWQGICGEDGPENVVLDPPRRALHEFMLNQREDGVLLTMASKNNEDDVLETFRAHPEMPLQPRHFVTWRLNWDPKAENLASIAEQLGLGLDSFIFVDDNPKECAEVEDSLPEVLTLALPADIDRTPRFLAHVWAFDHPVITEEDRNRSAYYRQAAEFGNAVKRARSLDDFIASLALRVTVDPLTPDKLPRAAQLTQRTNQFNTTTIRRTESDLQALSAQGIECFTMDVADRFGDYGLVGVMIVRPDGDALVVDSMLLSCRALGRGVEHRMLAEAAKMAADRGMESVTVLFTPTAKNKPARQFLESIGTNDEGEFRFRTADLITLEWRPALPGSAEAPKRDRKPGAIARAIDYSRIANELSTVPQILDAMRSTTELRFDPSMGETERQLASIWADLLETPNIRRGDNFFDIGGHSLLAVLLLMRISEAFGVELSIDDVYSGSLTLSDVAARIEAAQFGGVDPEEYAALLASVEELTDEEVSELLAREDGPSE
jgi:FkbH-like protein